MPEHFQVIGEDGEIYEVEGDDDMYFVDDEVSGDVMGIDVMGDDDDDFFDIDGEVGRRRRRVRRRRGRRKGVSLRRPSWRRRQVAPGVIAPDQGLVPLPLTSANNNTFDENNPTLTFEGQIQKPFRGERLLVSTVRTGTTAVGRLIGQLFIGTDLQQGDVQGFDIEQVGSPQAFGVRLTMKPAQPGVFIRIPCSLNAALTAPDTIIATVTLLGRIIQ